MQHPMRHQMLQVVRKRLALLDRFALADPERQGDVADLTFRIGRRGEGQNVGRQPTE